jgi:ligand-binding sensor domain-containing protein
MKIKSTLSIILLLFLMNAFPQSNEWVYFSGNKAINSVVIKGDNVWIGSALGPIMLNKTTGETKHFYSCNCKIPSNYMIDNEVDEEGNIWFATITGLVKFDGITWTAYDYVDIYVPIDFVNCFVIGPDGNKWIGTRQGAVVKFDGYNWEAYNLPDLPEPPEYYSVYDIEFDGNGDKWISTNHGVYVMRGDSFVESYLTDNSGLPGDIVNDIDIDKQGNKWIATNEGLAVIDDSGWRVYTTSNSGIPDNIINCVTSDPANNIWIGTKGGVVNYDGLYWSINYNNYGVPDQVFKIAIGDNQDFWFATDEGLINLNGNTYISKRYDFAQTNLGVGKINAIAFNDDNFAWIGGDGGLTQFDGSNWNLYTYQLPDPYVTSVVTAGIQVWIGTHGGLVKHNGYSWILFNTQNSDLPSDRINSIAQNGSEIWIGTDNGLVLVNGTNWNVFNSSNSNLPSTNIAKVAVNNGDVWLTTEDNYVVNFNREDPNLCYVYDTIRKMNEGPPPPPPPPFVKSTQTEIIINGIAFDKDNVKWFATNDGLVRFDGNEWEKVFFFPNDLLDLEFDQNGLLWLASSFYPGLYFKVDYNSGITYAVNTSMDQNPIKIAFDKKNNLWVGTGMATLGVFKEGGVDMDINGTVVDFTGDSIHGGLAYLYNTTNFIGGYDTVAVTDVINGKYIFEHVADCGYTVFSEPGISYPDLLPSYLGDTLLWMGSDTLQVQASTQADLITLHEKPPATFGNATITGEVVSDLGSPGNLKNTEIKDPIDNVGVVIIRKKKKKVVAYTQTDSEGRFSFRNIETGDYQVFMDYPGIPMDTLNDVNTLQIINSNDSISLLGTVSPTIIHLNKENLTKTDEISGDLKKLTISPNPFEISTTIEFPNDNHTHYLFVLRDLNGILVKTIPDITENKFIVLRENLSSGFYIFELLGEKKFDGKLLIQ